MNGDQQVRALIEGGAVRVVATLTTGLVAEAAARHGCVAAAQVALGRGLTAGLLLATLTKSDERVTVQLRGDGPLGGLTIDANDAGDVRGYVLRPDAFVPAASGQRTRLVEALGRHGVVNVVRDLGLKERYQGQTGLVTGEIDEDLEAYLRVSEQLDSALGCEVVLGPGGVVAAAGGLLVQALPEGDGAAVVREVQHRLRTGELFAALAAGVLEPSELITHLVPGQPVEGAAASAAPPPGAPPPSVQLLDRRPVRFRCGCSLDRVRDLLVSLGPRELEEMLKEDGKAEVCCNFCAEAYRFDRAALERLRLVAAGGDGPPSGGSESTN